MRPVGLDPGKVDSWKYFAKKGELRFVFKSRQNYDGLDFCAVGSGSIVQFDFQTFGEIIYNMLL